MAELISPLTATPLIKETNFLALEESAHLPLPNVIEGLSYDLLKTLSASSLHIQIEHFYHIIFLSLSEKDYKKILDNLYLLTCSLFVQSEKNADSPKGQESFVVFTLHQFNNLEPTLLKIDQSLERLKGSLDPKSEEYTLFESIRALVCFSSHVLKQRVVISLSIPKISNFPHTHPIIKALCARLSLLMIEEDYRQTKKASLYNEHHEPKEPVFIYFIFQTLPQIFRAFNEDSPDEKYRPFGELAFENLHRTFALGRATCGDSPLFTLRGAGIERDVFPQLNFYGYATEEEEKSTCSFIFYCSNLLKNLSSSFSFASHHIHSRETIAHLSLSLCLLFQLFFDHSQLSNGLPVIYLPFDIYGSDKFTLEKYASNLNHIKHILLGQTFKKNDGIINSTSPKNLFLCCTELIKRVPPLNSEENKRVVEMFKTRIKENNIEIATLKKELANSEEKKKSLSLSHAITTTQTSELQKQNQNLETTCQKLENQTSKLKEELQRAQEKEQLDRQAFLDRIASLQKNLEQQQLEAQAEIERLKQEIKTLSLRTKGANGFPEEAFENLTCGISFETVQEPVVLIPAVAEKYGLAGVILADKEKLLAYLNHRKIQPPKNLDELFIPLPFLKPLATSLEHKRAQPIYLYSPTIFGLQLNPITMALASIEDRAKTLLQALKKLKIHLPPSLQIRLSEIENELSPASLIGVKKLLRQQIQATIKEGPAFEKMISHLRVVAESLLKLSMMPWGQKGQTHPLLEKPEGQGSILRDSHRLITLMNRCVDLLERHKDFQSRIGLREREGWEFYRTEYQPRDHEAPKVYQTVSSISSVLEQDPSLSDLLALSTAVSEEVIPAIIGLLETVDQIAEAAILKIRRIAPPERRQ